ncbi:MAG: transcriptional regulator, partial [Anaerolinea sp.]|nr:transcriptional regulator [Anaerolinea sp.]
MAPSDMQNNSNSNLSQLSRQDFSRAYMKSFWRSIFSWIRNSSNELLPFDEVLKSMPLRGQHYLGFRQIETAKIIGSVSRYQDFDRAFLPRQTHTRARWESIDRAYFKDVILPPIEVYKIGEIYFVKDGNHRVSVAQERGQIYMDAYIIEIDIPGTLDENTNVNNLVLTHEYVSFLGQTKLDLLVPEENFRFSIPGQYDRLLQHISVHRWFMGEKLNRPVNDEEAVLGWYRNVFLPLKKIIQKHQIMREFPQRTETDLYLWIIEHRWYLAEELHRKVSLESAAMHYAKQFSTRPFRHIRQIYHWIKKRIFKI